MGRTLAAMLACLTVGAGGMWVASNFRVKFEPVGGPVTHPTPQTPPPADKPDPPPPVVASAPPEKLPAHLLPQAKTDAGVQQAGGSLPAMTVGAAPLSLGQPAGPVRIKAVQETIDTKVVYWDPVQKVLAATAQVAIPLENAPANAADLAVNVNDGPLGAVPASGYAALDTTTTPPTLRIDLRNAAWPKDAVKLGITGRVAGGFPATPQATVVIAAPGPAAGGQLLVSGYLDSPHLTATKTVPDVGGVAVQLHNGYLRLKGQTQANGGTVEFLTIPDPNAASTVAAAVPTAVQKSLSPTTGEWEYELSLGRQPDNAKGFLLCRTVVGTTHYYSPKLIPVQWLVRNTPVKPSFAADPVSPLSPKSKDDIASTTDQPAYRANQKTFTVTVAKPADAQVLLLYVGDQLTPAQARDVRAEAGATVTFPNVTVPGSGDHTVSAAGVNGNSEIGPRAKFLLRVRTTGPRAVSVAAPGFGTGAGRKETVSVQFAGEELDRDTAVVGTHYSLEHNEGNPKSKNLDGSVRLDPGNIVRLTFTEIVPGTYTFKVLKKGGTDQSPTGIRDVYGNFLVGPNGTTAEDAVFALTAAAAETQLPSQAAGVTLQTGPNVTFPEYTKFRQVPDGFNPSDRVETRVVRLYYTRDAHRVAQIVNRDVKSYNAATVDVRRRAADRARDDANISQDERQRLERAAIAAAGEARAAEGELRQLEAQLASARNEAVNARLHLTQREQQLTDARRELTRTEGGTSLRANDLVLAQQDRVKNIQDALAQTQALRATLPPSNPQFADLQRRENELKLDERDAQRELDRLNKSDATTRADRGNDPQRQQVRALEDEVVKLRQVQATGSSVEQSLQARISDARSRVQAKRVEEVRTNELALSKDREELRRREEQFRREVAAARADPDTYAPGLPESDDPVRQCSISVIGEGLIQIRGPVKGLNVIRTMINQIDAPTGQVRVGVHTVQVNGERQERMDKVVANIQRYLDHSRFLTVQSAQMLRKAVTLVASRKADEVAMTTAPGCSKAEQEQKYLYSFFGRDFVEELRQLDSEFLRTGNKLLSLHSMDSTSLSAALFLLALAKNDIRREILDEWQGQLQTKLPAAEMAFYTAGLACPDKCEAHCDKKFCVLSQNAKFTSFLGFFDAEVQGNDTLTPVQREFVRLAQIFKTRLVTELELKQRVMERTLLEDRLGDYMKESREAKEREDEAKRALFTVQEKMQKAIAEATLAFSQADQIQRKFETDLNEQDKAYDAYFSTTGYGFSSDGQGGVRIIPNANKPKDAVVLNGMSYALPEIFPIGSNSEDGNVDLAPSLAPDKYKWILDRLADTRRYLYQFYYVGQDKYRGFKETIDVLDDILKDKSFSISKFITFHSKFKAVLDVIRANIKTFQGEVSLILIGLQKEKPNVIDVLTRFTTLRADVFGSLREGGSLRADVEAVFTNSLDGPFKALQQAAILDQAAVRQAQLARRPLDEKKLLDMLVDEMEDKYIELLDGTRAHTANVDNYLKALATALDDDFQTQFYTPAFRKIRTLGTGWDVHLGQIESTSVLTNNRVLGKVQPAASMEFDLPRRSILIKEAMDGARAAVQDYGALLNDPVFLSMVKLYGGMPPSAQFGGAGGGLPAVRNVLPGLGGTADEMILAQGGSPRKQFGTNLEGIIPDPAIYKFETGTGYEIRPVISPDGQAVVFGFDYMYTTDLREPVRADEKHLGRVKRHFVHTDVQLSNFELREVSKYWVALKAARVGQGVQLLQDIPGVGALFRPAPSAQSSLQQNLIYSQAAIFPTLFDLMGLRYAPAVADIDPEFTKNDEFVVRGRRDYLRQFIFDYGASRVDDALRILYGERRPDLYRSQHTIPWVHPNGYQGPGLRQRDSQLREEYDPVSAYPPTKYAPGMHTPLPYDKTGRFDDPLGYPPPTLPGSGHMPYTPPSGATYGAKPTGSPVKEYGAKPLGTTVTRDPPPSGYTPLKASAPTAPPSRPSQPTVQAPGGRSAPLPALPPPPAKTDPLEVEPAPISTGQRGNPYQRR